MEFAPKPGCPMCGIVQTASRVHLNSPRSPSFPAGSTAPEVLWRDDNFTVYREKLYPISSKGHIIVVFNLHVPSLYTLSSSDVPLLVDLKGLAHRFLSSLIPPLAASPQLRPLTTTPGTLPNAPLVPSAAVRIGFITPPFKDSKIPVTDHLHAHAFLTPHDLCGWWRSVAYSPLAWYPIEDLIAEIRESTSNNRVKSGYENRLLAPIDQVRGAGARSGTANGLETTEGGLASPDMEGGERSPSSSRSRSPVPFLLNPGARSADGLRSVSRLQLSP